MRKHKGIVCLITIINLLLVNAVSYGAAVSYVSSRPINAVDYTAAEDIFRPEGSSDEFILLDYTEEGFFVTSKKYYGLHVYDPDITGKFDIEDPNNMAYWLNNEFLEVGNTYNDVTYKLPETITKHLVEREWLCEAGHITTDFSEDYTVKAKLALMSVTEWKKYVGKIGLKDDLMSDYYYLRSVDGKAAPTPTGSRIMVVQIQVGKTAGGKAQNPYGVRPVFYLDRDFFLKENIDITSLGDNVAKKLREVYSETEIKKAFGESGFERISRKLPPQVKNVKISGLPYVGQTLTAGYDFVSPENDAEGNSECRWLRSKVKDGAFSIIYGANKKQYVLQPEDEGYYICCEITPKTRELIGKSVRSRTTLMPIQGAKQPYAESVRIIGKPIVGERLIANYNYFDGNDDIEAGTVVKWQYSDDGNKYFDIPNANSVNWTIGDEYVGKYIRFAVQVRNEAALGKSETKISAPIGQIDKYPTIETPKISLKDNTVTVMSSISENAIKLWEVKNEEDKWIISKSGSDSYKLNGSEKKIRFRVIPTSKYGFMGDSVISEELIIGSIAPTTRDGVNEITIDGTQTIRVTPVEPNYACTLSIDFECEGVEIESIESESYNLFEVNKDDSKIYYMTSKSIWNSQIPDNVLTITVKGKGKFRIKDTSGVYKTYDGKYVQNIPEFLLIKQ